MNRKTLLLVGMLCLIFVIVGCSNNTANTPKPEENDKKTVQTEEREKQNNKEKNEKTEEELNPRDYERLNGEGEVAMSVIFANPLGEGRDGYLTFVGAFDNHAYNLDEYDLSKYASLEDDQGNVVQGEAKWELYSGGGHHIIGYLMFPDSGFITPKTEYVKLIIKDFIDVPQREFVWGKEFLSSKE